MMVDAPLANFADNGFACCASGIEENLLDDLARLALPGVAGRRNLLDDSPAVHTVAEGALRRIAARLLGEGTRPVRTILFDKTPEANWSVPWHQDQNIAVAARIDVPGFGPWTTKGGVPHVVPPPAVLEAMVTLRLHLDDCDAANGPLRVLPSTHRLGLQRDDQILQLAETIRPAELTAQRGDVVVMAPLLVHSSPRATEPNRRRVLHVEYAAKPLPGGLDWHARRAE